MIDMDLDFGFLGEFLAADPVPTGYLAERGIASDSGIFYAFAYSRVRQDRPAPCFEKNPRYY